MTTPVTVAETSILPEELSNLVAKRAKATDQGDCDARYILPLLAQAGLLTSGIEQLSDRPLLEMVRTIRELATYDLSVAFSTWAHRMVTQYISTTNHHSPALAHHLDWLQEGSRPGVTGMAPVMKFAANCGEIPLTAVHDGNGYRIFGKLAWASNLYEDAIIVTGAIFPDGRPGVFVISADTPGVHLGQPFPLLGLNATASSYVGFDGAYISGSAIITQDLGQFITKVKPTFTFLQISECLGVAIAATRAANKRVKQGLSTVFYSDANKLTDQVEQLCIQQENFVRSGFTQLQLIQLRLDSAQAAVDATALEVRVAGGSGYATSSATSRRFREATFLPVQSPSEAQLRWELSNLEQAC